MLFDVLFLTFYRHSVMTKETIPIIRAYDFTLGTLLMRNLFKKRLEIKIKS
jgi:hypothetical protein